MRTLLTLYLFALVVFVSGQDYSGHLLTTDKKPVEYANIGIANRSIGTVSGEDGSFSLSFKMDIFKSDTIIFSCIGYESLKLPVKKFCDKIEKGDTLFVLNQKDEMIREIVVRPKKYIHKALGNKTEAKRILAGFEENKLGYEIGTLMKIKRKPTFIDSIAFNVVYNSFDSVFFRLNIYQMEGKVPGENILSEPIYISYSKDDLADQASIDLKKYNLWVENDFVVTLEYITELGKGYFYFSSTFLSNPTFFRKTSQAEWEKSSVGIGICAWVTYEK